MTPGPDQVVACPHCDGLARYRTINSGNTFGARVWTDGRQIAPMLPRPPAVVRCQHCAKCYWLQEGRKVGSLPMWGERSETIDPTWHEAEYVVEPSEEEFCAAIAAGLAQRVEDEVTARILAWWRGNDAYRDGKTPQPIAEGARKKNLETLTHILEGTDPEDLLMKAEVLRHLGAFKPALEILARVEGDGYAGVVGQIRALCERGETGVQQLRFG